MADHDPMCPATIADGRWRARCECDLIARVVERERSTMDAREASARAEVERLRDAYEARDIALSEVAALREQEWAEPYRREVMDGLRAKVEGLEHDATCSFIPQDGPCDCTRGAVLALIEEAGQ